MARPKASGKPMKRSSHKKLKAVDKEYADLWKSGSKERGERKAKKGKPNIRQVDQGINQRPKASDEDIVPRSVKELMEGKLMAKKMKSKRGKKKKGPLPEHLRPLEKGMTKRVQPVPKFVQKRGESEWTFLNRMDREVKTVIAKTQFEEKFGVDTSVGKDGDVTFKKKNTKTKQKAKLRSKEKKQKDKDKKELKKLSKKTGFEILTDDVKFGEVAMAPPTLSKAPRGAPSLEIRPGRKNLLLKEIIHNVSTPEQESSGRVREIGKTIKRKNLPIAEQRKLDTERERVVDLYRQMKAKKYAANAL